MATALEFIRSLIRSGSCCSSHSSESPLIEVGADSYYDDPEHATEFETRNVTHHYAPERLVIGKFCAFAAGVTFVLNGVFTYPFPIMGGAWGEHADLISDLPSRGGTVVGNDV